MMNAVKKKIEHGMLKNLVPFQDLPGYKLDELMKCTTTEILAAGSVLMESDDIDHCAMYLLSGEVGLAAPDGELTIIRADTLAGRYPLTYHRHNHEQIHARTHVTLLKINWDVLNQFLQDSTNDSATHGSFEEWATRWMESPLFTKLPPENIEMLFNQMQEIKVFAGEVIIRQGDADNKYYVIKKGRAVVTRRPAPQSKEIKLAELIEGQGFGEEALITSSTRNATVTMVEDGYLMQLSKDNFIEYMAQPLLHHVSYNQAISMTENGAVLLDVREAEEFETNGLLGALNMPMPVLRLKAARLNKQHTYITYCDNTQLSSAAAFLLMQQGLDACVLTGGLNNAPKQRMKRTRIVTPDLSTVAVPAKTATIVRLPVAGNHNTDAALHWVSDKVLWETTLGYRQDAKVDAILSGTASQPEAVVQAEPEPQADATVPVEQGFESASFTKIPLPAAEPKTQPAQKGAETTRVEFKPAMETEANNRFYFWFNVKYSLRITALIGIIAIMAIACIKYAGINFSDLKTVMSNIAGMLS